MKSHCLRYAARDRQEEDAPWQSSLADGAVKTRLLAPDQGPFTPLDGLARQRDAECRTAQAPTAPRRPAQHIHVHLPGPAKTRDRVRTHDATVRDQGGYPISDGDVFRAFAPAIASTAVLRCNGFAPETRIRTGRRPPSMFSGKRIRLAQIASTR